jgi:hypothetical protein
MQLKKWLFLIAVAVVTIYAVGCKKCYTCHNSCVLCSATYNGHTFTQVLCNDSFATPALYDSAIARDTSIGYRCAATTSTYNYDFCENQPGVKEGDTSYYDHGGRAPCTAK